MSKNTARLLRINRGVKTLRSMLLDIDQVHRAQCFSMIMITASTLVTEYIIESLKDEVETDNKQRSISAVEEINEQIIDIAKLLTDEDDEDGENESSEDGVISKSENINPIKPTSGIPQGPTGKEDYTANFAVSKETDPGGSAICRYIIPGLGNEQPEYASSITDSNSSSNEE